jgi:hypothetical protein
LLSQYPFIPFRILEKPKAFLFPCDAACLSAGRTAS